MADLLAAVRRLIELINKEAASGLMTQELLVQTLRVDQLLRRLEKSET